MDLLGRDCCSRRSLPSADHPRWNGQSSPSSSLSWTKGMKAPTPLLNLLTSTAKNDAREEGSYCSDGVSVAQNKFNIQFEKGIKRWKSSSSFIQPWSRISAAESNSCIDPSTFQADRRSARSSSTPNLHMYHAHLCMWPPNSSSHHHLSLAVLLARACRDPPLLDSNFCTLIKVFRSFYEPFWFFHFLVRGQ